MHQMRAIATLMLGLAVAGSAISWNFRGSFTGGLIFAACEAATVGALADWFAVVALFRHPLGLKFIPHTAIIPNKRGKIVEGIVKTVEKDWLSLDFIKGKIQTYSLVDEIASALDNEKGRQGLERIAHSITISLIERLEPKEISDFIHNMIAANVESIKVSPKMVENLETGFKDLYTEDVISVMLDWAIITTNSDDFQHAVKRILTKAATDYSNQGNFMRRLSKGLGESLDIVNYDEAAYIISRRINQFLLAMQSPDNHYRLVIRKEIKNLKLADPQATATKLSGILKEAINSESGLNATTNLIAFLRNQWLDDGKDLIPLISYLTDSILEQIRSIRMDETRKNQLENWLKTELISLLERYHGVLGIIVREKLQNLNDADLVQSLEDKVGDDLQWIRINGTVIGALVGIGQYLLRFLLS